MQDMITFRGFEDSMSLVVLLMFTDCLYDVVLRMIYDSEALLSVSIYFNLDFLRTLLTLFSNLHCSVL